MKTYSAECTDRKNNEQIQERTNRTKPVFNSTIQLVIVIPHTKYELFILYGCAGRYP